MKESLYTPQERTYCITEVVRLQASLPEEARRRALEKAKSSVPIEHPDFRFYYRDAMLQEAPKF